MQEGMNYSLVAPEAYRSYFALYKYQSTTGIDKVLGELIKIRVAQINSCAYCIDVHTKDARRLGEDETRLYQLSAWRESPLFDEVERAVLQFTEDITLIADRGVPQETWDAVAQHFDEQQIADLMHAIITINVYTRVSVATKMVPGLSKPVFPKS